MTDITRRIDVIDNQRWMQNMLGFVTELMILFLVEALRH